MARRHSRSSRRTKPKWRGASRCCLTKGYPYLVAERAGTLAGYAYAGPYRDRRAYDWCVEDSIYVAPEFHRQGIGRLLLTRLIAEAETPRLPSDARR